MMAALLSSSNASLSTAATFSTQSTSSSSTSSSTSSNVDVALAERAFLEGSFSEALSLANRCLKHQDKTCAGTEEKDILADLSKVRPLLTPLLVKFDRHQKIRYISFHWDNSISQRNPESAAGNEQVSTAFDRAAAIALQSWYELYRLEDENRTTAVDKSNKQTDEYHLGYPFLQPFLDTYTSTVPGDVLGRRVMSLDLLWLWIQWLSDPRHIQHGPDALRLTVEVLRHVRSLSQTPLLPCQQQVCRNLLVGLMTCLLPKYANTITTQQYLQSLQGEGTKTIRPQVAAGEASKQVIQQCLCFCTTDDGNWPHWLRDTFRDCRVALRSKLQEIYDQEQQQQKSLVVAAPSESPSLSGNAMDTQLPQHSVSTFAFTGKFVVPTWLRRAWTSSCEHVRTTWVLKDSTTAGTPNALAAVSNRTFVSQEWLRQQLQALLQRYIHLLSQATKLGQSRIQMTLLVGLLSALCFWKRSKRQSPR
jgi:hypothetical protein